jgi:PTH1 family peptidyl-tRNA hydrolase
VKLIAGLGNPGPRYADSRHNVGFAVVDELARRWQADELRYDRDFAGLLGQATPGGAEVLLLKPATYMNESGRSVAAVWRYYKLAAADVLIIHDDLDLPVGQSRLRGAGSSGGHKGMDDVIRCLGTDEIPRLRIGIGKVHRSATVEYVLSRFEPQERPVIETTIGRAADAAECWRTRGLDAAMNEYNRYVDVNPRRTDQSGGRPAAGERPSEGESS